MARLSMLQPANPPEFSRDMIADLPEPARRYFTFAISEGTPLRTVVRLKMEGRFGMGDKSAPGYQSMQADQVLAAPYGFVWSMTAGSGMMHLSGSDSGSWTRFWLAGLFPVARLGGEPDHARSAFGRYIAESVFWSPAALLPGPGVSWMAVSENMARVTVQLGELKQAVDISVDAQGQLQYVKFERWSNANSDKTYRLQPFGGYLSEYREFSGFRLPTHVEAGNRFETDTYFPFFIADVTKITFPGSGS
ncbi:DUF6544 family protein [Hyphobacterium sp.]|uniref:DUF6544 family protein n=1 Tax=Hyphobacterium sp. TaxID=2004662 RepID=UPI003B52C53E